MWFGIETDECGSWDITQGWLMVVSLDMARHGVEKSRVKYTTLSSRLCNTSRTETIRIAIGE